ncbi:unnamed protein product [Ectocarpus sp. 4 AP-2014]
MESPQHQLLGAPLTSGGGGGGGSGSAPYDALFQGLVGSGCIAGLALLDASRGRPLYENRLDDRLPRPPPAAGAAAAAAATATAGAAAGKENKDDEKEVVGARSGGEGPGFRYGLVSSSEGQRLVAAVKNLTDGDDALCRKQEEQPLTCMGVPFRVFGGTPLGIYAVGPGRRVGLIVRALPRVGFLVVVYRRPHMPQQVVGEVEKFVDDFWAGTQGRAVRSPLPPPPPPRSSSTRR